MWHRLFVVLVLAATGVWGYDTRSPQVTAQPSSAQAVAEADTLVASAYVHSSNRSGSGRRRVRR